MSELKDLKLSGSGTVSGGDYNEIRISGAGKVDGDCSANELIVSGAATLSGKCKAKKMVVSGVCNFSGSVNTEYLKIAGSSKADYDVEATELKVSGSFKTDSNVIGSKANISGRLHCGGDVKYQNIKISGVLNALNVESEDFEARGLLKIEGMLNSENIDITLEGKSTIGEIGGKTIKIKGSNDSKPIKRIISVFTGTSGAVVLDSDFIEGDDIYLENVKVKMVSGQDVVVGRHCVVDKVTYTNSLKIEDGAMVKVKEQV